MLKTKLTEKDQRALKLVAGAVGIFLLLQYLVLPLWDGAQDARLQIATQEQILGKYRRAIAAAGPRDKEAEDVAGRLRQAESRLLQAGTEALASAELEKLVKELATGTGIELRSSEFIRASQTKAGYREVPVGIVFQSRVDQLVNLLSAVQSSHRLLSISKLAVQPAGGARKEVLVSMTIAGWLKAGEATQN